MNVVIPPYPPSITALHPETPGTPYVTIPPSHGTRLTPIKSGASSFEDSFRPSSHRLPDKTYPIYRAYGYLAVGYMLCSERKQAKGRKIIEARKEQTQCMEEMRQVGKRSEGGYIV